MPPQSRAEWQNFVNSEDIEPLGRAYGYQLELPINTRRRIDDFFTDPRNLRGLLGEITTDPGQNPRAAALRTKETLQQNPDLLRDIDTFVENRPRFAAAGLQDAYALRQLFGESPLGYGATDPDVSTERRGVTLPSTGQRVRVTEAGGLATPLIPTTELSPAERTFATAPSLRPQIFVQDLDRLGDPELMERVGVQQESNLNRARQIVRDVINEDIGTVYAPVSLDALNNADDEALRRLVNRNQLGTVRIAGEFPGEVASSLQNLLSQSGADPDYILNYLQNERELPSEASEPRPDFFEDYDVDDYEEVERYRPIDRTYAQTLKNKYPELEKIEKGPTARGSRLPKEQLFETYKSYIPENYRKLAPEEKQSLKNVIFAGDNPQARQIFYRTVDGIYPPNSSFGSRDVVNELTNLRQQSETIEDPVERARVTSYLDEYLSDIDSKVKQVSPRLAGVGGGRYLETDVISDLYPKAAEKLRTLGTNAYFPEDFQPRITNIFYSSTGRPYKVRIDRVPSNIVRQGLSSNFVKMIEDKPLAGVFDIDFSVNGKFLMDDPNIPNEVKAEIKDFVKNNALRGLPAGSLVRNSPVADETFRTNKPGNKRAGAYQQSGFGGQSREGQFAYIDPDTGLTVPVQPYRQKNLVGEDFMRAYYSMDPVTAGARGLSELGKAIKRTPASLLPGAADLIPSPEAIQTGYRQGPLAMGRQMGQEFVQSLPAAAGASAALAAVPVLAPGIGTGLVGSAAARAVNEIIRQETGEGIVPKLRQFAGTAPRTGVATKARRGEQPLTATVRQSTPRERAELTRQQNRSELQRRLDLVRERFNPRRGEFGVSELLFGR